MAYNGPTHPTISAKIKKLTAVLAELVSELEEIETDNESRQQYLEGVIDLLEDAIGNLTEAGELTPEDQS